MKNALTQQAHELSVTEALEGNQRPNEALAAKLRESQKRCVLLEAKLVQVKAAGVQGIEEQLSTVSAKLAQCEVELADAHRTVEAKSARIAELERELAELQHLAPSSSSKLASDRVAADARNGDLRRKLTAAESDIQRLVQERSQLMELSNQLRADLRKLRDSSGQAHQSTTREFAGKKDLENLVAELSRSLEESRLHNKTLKKELRRMVKFQVLASNHAPAPASSSPPTDDVNHGDDSRHRTLSAAVSSDSRRRSSTLSMMRAIEPPNDLNERDDSRRRSGDAGRHGGGDFDAELLILARNKRPSGSGSHATATALPERRRTSTRSSLSTADTVRGRTASSASRPKSIRERENEDDATRDEDEREGDDDSDTATKRARGTAPPSGAKSALSSLFQPRDAEDAEQHTTARVSDARLRLQQDIL